jgi:O-antigen/teichoic acid export membrane protein
MALTEQFLFALSGFAINVLFARWLVAEEYGAFALASSLIQLANTFHTALFTEPLLIFGAGKYSREFKRYLSALVGGHWAGTGALCAALALGAAIASGHPLLVQAFLGLAAAVPFVLLLRLMRRACIARLRPALSAIGAGVYLLLVLAGAGALHFFNLTSVFSGLLLLGAASLVAGVILGMMLRRLGDSATSDKPEATVEWKEVRAAHWRYGRWAVGANLLWWVPLNSGVVLVSALGGLEASATLKAMLNLTLPLIQANAALGALLLPALVIAKNDSVHFARLLKLFLLALGGGALLYYLTIGIIGKPLVHALYNGRYDHSVELLWVLGLIVLFDGAATVLSGALRALQRPDKVFWSYLGAAMTMLLGGLVLIPHSKLNGASLAMVASFVTACCLLAAHAYSLIRANDTSKATPATVAPHASVSGGAIK